MVSANIQSVSVSEEYIASTNYDVQTLIGLLDAEVSNPQMLNQLATKFISKVFIQRESKRLLLTVQMQTEGTVLLEKTIVAEV